MSDAYYDQIKKCHGSYEATVNGNEFVITMVLNDVPGADDMTQLWNALNDPKVPAIGTDRSDINEFLSGCWLRKIDADAISAHTFLMTLHYQHSPLNKTLVSASSQMNQIETNKDKDGNPVTLQYTYPADYGGTAPTAEEEALRGETKDQGGTVTKMVPEAVRVYQIREAVDPTNRANEWEGTLNQDPWALGAIGEWMITSITGENDNSLNNFPLRSWLNTYTFQRRIGGWNPEAIYSDVLTNEPVPDPVEDESIKTIPSYEFKNFTALEDYLFNPIISLNPT